MFIPYFLEQGQSNWNIHTVNPLLRSPRRYLFQAHLGGEGGRGLIETRGLFEKGGLFNLEKTMVSVLHKELEYKVKKLKYKKVGGHPAEDQNQIGSSSLSFISEE